MDSPQLHNSYQSSSNTPGFMERIDESIVQFQEPDINTEKVCGISLRTWNHVTLLLNFLSLIFSISSLSSPRWVEQGPESDFWRGGALFCSGCSGKFKNQSYSYISAIACDSLPGYCQTFRSLYYAGIVVVFLEIVFAILCCGAILLNLFRLFEKYSENKAIPVIVASIPFLQIIALVSWLGISGAKINGDCYQMATNKIQAFGVCAIDGPILMIVSIFLTLCAAACYFIIRPGIKKSIKNKISPYEEN